jgi:hypothetical protein
MDHADFTFLNFTTGIPRFTLLMWGHKKNRGSKNRVYRGYLGPLHVL